MFFFSICLSDVSGICIFSLLKYFNSKFFGVSFFQRWYISFYLFSITIFIKSKFQFVYFPSTLFIVTSTRSDFRFHFVFNGLVCIISFSFLSIFSSLSRCITSSLICSYRRWLTKFFVPYSFKIFYKCYTCNLPWKGDFGFSCNSIGGSKSIYFTMNPFRDVISDEKAINIWTYIL